MCAIAQFNDHPSNQDIPQPFLSGQTGGGPQRMGDFTDLNCGILPVLMCT